LALEPSVFYDENRVAIMPMGFCYPGKGKSGDLAPRKECASTWHDKIIKELNKLELYILIGQYAQAYYLGHRAERSLTETVRNTKKYLPSIICLPHPSPRNNIWLKRNPWFEEEILPLLRQRVFELSP